MPKAHLQPSTESKGHFDASDLVRRLEAHQAYSREGYRLNQQREKDRQAAKRLAAEKDAKTTELHVAGGNVGDQGGMEERPNPSTTIQGARHDVVIAKHVVLRHRNLSQDSRTRRRKSRPSSIKGTINKASLDRARHWRRPTYVLPDKTKPNLQWRADAEQGRIRKDGGWKESTTLSQPFKIYIQESSLHTRPTVTIMNVLDKSGRKGVSSCGNITYVPRNAALGLAKTTTHGIDERGKLMRSLSENRPSTSGTGKPASRITTQNANQRSSMPTLRTTCKEDTTLYTCNSKPVNAKLARVDEEKEKAGHEKVTTNTTKQPVGSSDGNEVPLQSNDSTEHKDQQRHTLRKKLSRMRLLGRRVPDEDADALPQTSPEKKKPATPRRKSIRLMFR